MVHYVGLDVSLKQTSICVTCRFRLQHHSAPRGVTPMLRSAAT
jgi:hypothetical protein